MFKYLYKWGNKMKIEIDIDSLGDFHGGCLGKGVERKHRWGYERWIVNEGEYCAKLLVLENGEYSSKHYHSEKKETFIVLGGRVLLHRWYGDDSSDSEGETMKVSDMATIPSGITHKFRGIETPAVILEVSTHHDDGDTYRVEE